MEKDMKKQLGIADERYQVMIKIKEDYLEGRISLEEGNRILREKIGTCTPDEFAYGEQMLKGRYTDEVVTEKMEDLLTLFEGVIVRAENVYPENHPLWVFKQEIEAVEKVLVEAEELLQAPNFIKNPWLGIFDSLKQWRKHLSRKQNQLYPMLERYGFDRPTRIMWTFDDNVRDGISAALGLLETDNIDEFLVKMPQVIADVRDLNAKELEVLLPTSFKLLTEEEFVEMSRSDYEIGYALIEAPAVYQGKQTTTAPKEGIAPIGHESHFGAPHCDFVHGQGQDFVKDLAALLSKYQIGAPAHNAATLAPDTELDVATGKLSLERINLIFKHMPVDLSYVDENELVKFYSDTKHRIFPRSASVIGREVKNCHPAKSVHVVEEIIEKFRSGEQSQAEFWINKPGMFIYVLYTAVRDEAGNFKGVLEMMQDCTHIRELEGSRTLLTWEGYEGVPAKEEIAAEELSQEVEVGEDGALKLTPNTTIGALISRCPSLVDFLPTINPKLEKIKSPMGKVMAKMATLKMVSEHAEVAYDDLVARLTAYMNEKK